MLSVFVLFSFFSVMLLQKVIIISSLMNKLDSIEKSMSVINSKLNSVHPRVTKLDSNLTHTHKWVNELEHNQAFDSQICEELKSALKSIQDSLSDEKRRNEQLTVDTNSPKHESARLTEETLDLQSSSLRENLFFQHSWGKHTRW